MYGPDVIRVMWVLLGVVGEGCTFDVYGRPSSSCLAFDLYLSLSLSFEFLELRLVLCLVSINPSLSVVWLLSLLVFHLSLSHCFPSYV